MTTLERVLARCPLLTIDAQDRPVMVTLHTVNGPRNYAGRDAEDALQRAESGTRPQRIEVEP